MRLAILLVIPAILVGMVIASQPARGPVGDILATTDLATFDEVWVLARSARGLDAPRADRDLTEAAHVLAAGVSGAGAGAENGAADAAAAQAHEQAGDRGAGASVRALSAGAAGALAISTGPADPRDLLRGWMAEPATRRVLLLPDAGRYGLGRSGDIWVLAVATPADIRWPPT